MTTAVKTLLDTIDLLPEDQREELECALNDRLEREFLKESKKAARLAKKRGITVAQIDREIERRRYGK